MFRFDLWTSLRSIAEQCGVSPLHGHWLDQAVGDPERSDHLGFNHSHTFLGAPLPFHLLQALPCLEEGRSCCGFCVWRKPCCLWQHQPKEVQMFLVDPLKPWVKVQWSVWERWPGFTWPWWWGWHEVAREWIIGSNGRDRTKVKLKRSIVLLKTLFICQIEVE